MGSKMSFGRGSTDQNSVSEITSVGPRSSIHEPSEQGPKDKWSPGKDQESRYDEDTRATQLPTESSSSGHRNLDCPVNSESVDKLHCQQSEQHTSSPDRIEGKSDPTPEEECATDRGTPVRAHRRRRRSRKAHQASEASDPMLHEKVTTKIPSPASLENHNSDELPNTVDDRLSDNMCEKVESNPCVSSDNNGEAGPCMLPRKKRGRPKKDEMSAFSSPISDAVAESVPAAPLLTNISRPVRIRRNREPLNLKTVPSHADCPQAQPAANIERSDATNFQDVKRRSCNSECDQQAPAKVSKLSDAQEVISSCNDTGCAETTEVDRLQVEDDGKLPAAEGSDDQLLTQAALEKEQLNEAPSPQKVLLTQPEPEVEHLEGVKTIRKGTKELQSQTSPLCESPVNVESQKVKNSIADITASSEDAQKSVELPLEVKDEDEEIEVDSMNPGSQLNSLNPSKSSDAYKSESLTTEFSVFRRKRGGKRRRKITKNVEVSQEDHVRKPLVVKEDPAPTDDGCYNQELKDNDDMMHRADVDVHPDAIYIQKGSKTLMKCRYCERLFKFQSQFIIHVRIHTGERPFKCQECGKGFSKNSNLNLHLKTHNRNKMYQSCPFCNIKFSVTEYASHMELHAQEFVPEIKRKPKPERRRKPSSRACDQEAPKPIFPDKGEEKVCPYCSKRFRFQSALIRHIRVHTGEKPYKCDICGKAFGQAYFLRVHELTHWSVKRYNCTRCQKSFTHYSNAKNHTCRPVDGMYPNMLGKPLLTYTCHICKNIFDHLQEFNSHMRDHKGAKLYRCLYCDKLFGVLSEFNAHHSRCKAERNDTTSDIKEEETMSLIQYTVPALRCATGSNPGLDTAANHKRRKKQPQTCHKERSTNTNHPFQSTIIPAHPLSHLVSKLNKLDSRSDPRKYLCPGCGRLFRHMGRLRAHMLTHSPDRSYSCACCGRTLASWKKLWRHQRVHRQRRGRFSCPRCGEGFRFAEPYKKHMRTHPEYQWVQVRPKKSSLPYRCEQCTCRFKTLDLLFSHKLYHSSAQDTVTISNLDLCIEDHNTQTSKNLKHPPANSSSVLRLTHEEKSTSGSSGHFTSAAQASSTPMIPLVPTRSVNLASPSGIPIKTYSIQDRKASNERTNENLPVTPLKTVKPHVTVKKFNTGSSDGVLCAICGKAFSAISELYQHYLQHARGQV